MRIRITTTALAALAIAAGLTVSACSSAPAEPAPSAERTTEAPALPADVNEADVAFTSGMIAHHEQAIEMSDLVLAKTGVDERVVALAEEIKTAQGPEIEQLRDWLAEWGVEEDAAAGGHGGHGEHGGMISEEGIAELEAADGATASKLFLEQMIEHHEGALDMAEPAVEGGENPDVVALAQSVIDAQTAEIAHMRELLAAL